MRFLEVLVVAEGLEVLLLVKMEGLEDLEEMGYLGSQRIKVVKLKLKDLQEKEMEDSEV
jgi:hypothetical protein